MDILAENECPRRKHHLHILSLKKKCRKSAKKCLFLSPLTNQYSRVGFYNLLPGGPRIVETHSYKLSPFGPAEQFGGGSRVISASSFCMRFADVPSAFDILGFGLDSFVSGLGAVSAAEEFPALPPLPLRRPPPLEPAPLLPDEEVDILYMFCRGEREILKSDIFFRWRTRKEFKKRILVLK